MLMNQKFDTPRVVDMFVGDQTIKSGDLDKIMEPIFVAADLSMDFDTYETSVAGFSDAQKLVHALMCYDLELSGGGHKQFFMSRSGMLWKVALKACQDLGLRPVRTILQGATLRLAGDPPFSHEDRVKLLKNLSPRFADLDDQAQELDLKTMIAAYISAHEAEFLFNGAKRH